MRHPNIAIPELVLRRSTPVVVNSFNQLTYLRNMVERLRDEGFRNLYILDQASTHRPLKDWLAGVEERNEALPLFSATNNGPHDFFIAGKYKLFGGAPFVYSDPDLSWDQLAPDFLTRLFRIANDYRVFKVGPALSIPPDHDAKPVMTVDARNGASMGVAEFESRYWTTEVEPGVYNAPIDTTMHLFVPQYYTPGVPLITGLRVAGDGYSLKHLPWFKSDPMPREESDFYSTLSRHTTWHAVTAG